LFAWRNNAKEKRSTSKNKSTDGYFFAPRDDFEEEMYQNEARITIFYQIKKKLP